MLTALRIHIFRSNAFSNYYIAHFEKKSNVRRKRIKESRKKGWKQENSNGKFYYIEAF